MVVRSDAVVSKSLAARLHFETASLEILLDYPFRSSAAHKHHGENNLLSCYPESPWLFR